MDAMNPFAGAGAFFQGMAFVVTTPRVWPRAMVPVLVALLLFAGVVAAGVFAASRYTHGVYVVLLAVPAVLLAIVVALSFAQPLSGWALDGIVRAQRRELGLPELPHVSVAGTMLASAGSALLALLVGAPVIAALTVVGWAAPPALVVTVPLKIVVGALMVAWDLVDYPLAMRGATLRQRLRFAWQHFGSFLGFGLAATAFFAIPGLGLIALPCGVAGAAQLVER
jgi:CysZ protein